jgi:hypothetical protein
MTWYLATEDQLSSTIASKLIQSVHPESEITADLGLTGNWIQNKSIPSKLLFRVAVREAEAWLMADTDAFSAFSGVSKGKIPRDNMVLCDFVRGQWSAERAAVKAPSLRRAMERVRGV